MKVSIYNKNLNPDFWTVDKTLRPEVRIALLNIGRTFFSDTELKMHIRDILFLGSSANYNWTSVSDCDLHVLVDFNDLPMSPELAKNYTRIIAKKWNTDHDIKIKNHNVEVYIQDVTEENRSTGVYSLTQNKWIKEALPQNIVLDKNLIQKKYTTWVRKIKMVIQSHDVVNMKNVLDGLVKMRENGLSAAGEFSTENLVFKILRQRGIITQLKNEIQNLKNGQFSVNDGFDPQSQAGPNPNVTIGDPNVNFYQSQISKMKRM